MTISDYFGCANHGEEGEEGDYRPPHAQTKKMSSTLASPLKGGEGNNYDCSAARRLEESREALALSSGRHIEVPIPTPTDSTASSLQATSSLASTTHSNTCSGSTNATTSCISSLAMTATPSIKITSSSSLLPPRPDVRLRPLLMSRPPRAAIDSSLLRQALHNSESLRGLNVHNVRHRYTAWEIARAKMQNGEHEHEHEHDPLWVLEHGMSSASSSGDEDDVFESGMKNLWSDILDEYEDEQMVRWDHWSGRKLQPDQLELDDEY